MKKKKVLVVTGTRAEWGLLSPVAEEIRKSTSLDLRLLVTGMHTLKKYGDTVNDIRREQVRIDCIVPVKEGSMSSMLAEEIRGIEKYCMKNRPDIILVLGDRDEPFAAAIVGGHLRIPVAHIHGGDATHFVVDDAIRHSITKFAHIHFPVSRVSAKRLETMGEEKSRIHYTGSTAFDTLSRIRLASRSALAEKHGLDAKAPWIMLLQHPTPLDPIPVRDQIQPTIRALKKIRAQKVFVYPNNDSGSLLIIDAIERAGRNRGNVIFRSLPRAEYLSFLKHVDVLVGNSSSGILEAAYFKTPVVNIGDRQKGREFSANVVHVPYSEKKILVAVERALTPAFRTRAQGATLLFGHGGASKKIRQVLERLSIDEELLNKHIPERQL